MIFPGMRWHPFWRRLRGAPIGEQPHLNACQSRPPAADASTTVCTRTEPAGSLQFSHGHLAVARGRRTTNGGRFARIALVWRAFVLLFAAGLADARCLAELLRHFQVMLERGQRLPGPVLQLRIVAAAGVALEQRHCVLVRADLIGVEIRAEIRGGPVLELVELRLV